MYDSGYISLNVNMFISLLLFIFAYSWIDVQLQITDEERKIFESKLSEEERKKAEINMMKVVHDLKNPILAIEELVDDQEEEDELTCEKNVKSNGRMSVMETTDEEMCMTKICLKCKKIFKHLKSELNFETSDLLEMLENLKTSFKLGHNMEIAEENVHITTQKIVQSICKTHKKLAINGFNEYTVQVHEFFPKNLCIQKTLFKRVVNNIISNSLKHTYCGKVEISFDQSSKINEFCSKYFFSEYIHVGSKVALSKNYIIIIIKDNGIGIAANKLNLIFGEQQSDQSERNWDGTGLGLPICAAILQKAGGFIRYWSIENHGTTFCIFYPHPVININKDPYYTQTQLKSITNPNISQKIHSCNEVIIAEDNSSILKKYEKFYSKNNIAYQSFTNGRACYDYIKDLNCHKCSKSLILTDQMMPFMTGNQMSILIRKLKSERQYIIALITAEEEELNTEYNHIFDYIVTKPIPVSRLRNLHDITYGSIEQYIYDLQFKSNQEYYNVSSLEFNNQNNQYFNENKVKEIILK